MTLNVISDLHCGVEGGKVDWLDFEPEKLKPADYLIVAGDTGYADTEAQILRELRQKTKGKFKKVLSIKGNHSYWVWNNNSTIDHMVSNNIIDLVDGDVAIIGTTLWTNNTSFSEVRYMNDYNRIPGFNPAVKQQRFYKESAWLRRKWYTYKELGKKVVIVTHHNPRSPSELPEYSWEHSDVASAYWVMDHYLDDVKPDLWICGHIHEPFSGIIDGVRFERHPIGYRWGWYKPDVKTYPHLQKVVDSWYDKVVEV